MNNIHESFTSSLLFTLASRISRTAKLRTQLVFRRAAAPLTVVTEKEKEEQGFSGKFSVWSSEAQL